MSKCITNTQRTALFIVSGRFAGAVSAEKHLPSTFPAMEQIGGLCQNTDGLAQDLKERGGIDLSEGFIDGFFAPAKKGAMVWVKPKGAKEPKLWALSAKGGLSVFLSPLTQAAPARMK
jgi:hypothetical protein